jgi:signal-transduction protein with cAMP-binding, CBS, and nucleotidyltransferase domain
MVKTVFKTGGGGKRSIESFAVECKAQEFVFKEGDLGTEMYIIQEGRIEILKQIEGDLKQLAVLEKGDFFGEMSVLEDLPRTASARASVDSRLLQINGSTFDQMLRSNPEIAVRMMRKLSRRLRETDALLKDGATVQQGSRAHEVPPPPVQAKPRSVGTQRLVHDETGQEFFLSAGSETTVGRQDPVTGINPDVDLTEIDTQRSTSRRHAKIYRRGNKFFITEEIGTTNGTFINGDRVETGVPFEVSTGDQVQFGLVKMHFRAD